MNSVKLSGTLLEKTVLPDEESVMFLISVPKKFKRKGKPESDAIRCIAFSKTAESLCRIRKDEKILVEGIWETKHEAGGRLYMNICRVTNVEL